MATFLQVAPHICLQVGVLLQSRAGKTVYEVSGGYCANRKYVSKIETEAKCILVHMTFNKPGSSIKYLKIFIFIKFKLYVF